LLAGAAATAVLVFVAAAFAWGDLAEDLEAKAVEAGRMAERYHVREGLLIPTRIEATEGPGVYDATSQEDVCTRSGEYLFALCFESLATDHPDARLRADRTARAMLELERVTGVPGLVARAFKKSDGPTLDEESFFFPLEWHQSPAKTGYRWLGDLSVDQLNDWMIGLCVYHDSVARDDEKTSVAAAIDRVASRLLDHDLRIVDWDGKMTLWGNMSPSLPHEPLNALLGLSNVKIAWHITGKDRYRRYFRQLIQTHKYHEQIALAKVLHPPYAINGSDDNLAIEALWNLMRLEDDAALRQYYRISFERHWQQLQSENVALYDFFREALWPGEAGSIDEHSLDQLKAWHWRREKETHAFRSERGPVTVTGWFSDAPFEFLRAYWFGRYQGFVPAPGGKAARLAPTPAVRDPQPEPAPPGMVHVPAGPFIMGSEIGDADESPERVVHLDGFFIDRFEVTNEQFAKFDRAHAFTSETASRPALATWTQAAAYAQWAGKRLPTEVEWEKAARGVDGRLFPWGNTWEIHLAPWSDEAPVGSTKTDLSPYGCYDMAGNVWEWTADWYQRYSGNTTPSDAYGERFKAIRGGASFNDGSMMRCSHRYYMKPDTRVPGHGIGFRCVRDSLAR
jgi:formylglycine-generating enzyme required for sulfatase activity